MDGGSPSRHKEKRSKKNQDRATVPEPSGRTKASYKCGGASGSRATRRCDDQGSSAAAPPTPAFVGDMPIVDEEEEALERAGCTIAAPPVHTLDYQIGLRLSACSLHGCVTDHASARHGSESCWWMDSSSFSGLSSPGYGHQVLEG